MKHGVVYKMVNRFCRKRFIYFMYDVPSRPQQIAGTPQRLVVPATCGYVLVNIRNFAHTHSYQIGTNNDCTLS